MIPPENERIFQSLMPPRRALTEREEALFNIARRAIFEQRRQHEAEGKTLPPFDEDRIYFRADLAAYDQALSEQPQSTKASSDDA